MFSVFFLSFFSILMLNCFKLVKWHHQNSRNGNSGTFYIELCMKPMGVVLNLPLLKKTCSVTLYFYFFFLKGIIIVGEMEINS